MSGNIDEVKRQFINEGRDVKGIIGRTRGEYAQRIKGRPLYVALRNIKKEKDEWFQISELLLQHKDIDVNEACGDNEKLNASTIFCSASILLYSL